MSAEETAPNGTTTPAQQEAPWVAERVQKITAQRNNAMERITELEREVERLNPLADRADAWKQKAEGLTTQLSEAEGKWATDRSLLEAGITDGEVRDLFQWQYSRLEGEDTPAFGDWLAALRKEGAEVPAVLRAYMAPTPPPAPEAEATTAEAPPAPPQVTMPQANLGTRPAPLPKASPTGADVSQMDGPAYDAFYREQALKNGWTLPDRLRKS
jgi:hypothetical protein